MQNPKQTIDKDRNKKFLTLIHFNNRTEKIARKFGRQDHEQNKTHIVKIHTQTAKKFDLPGIYKVNCSECNKFYVGQTERSFK